MLKDPTYCKKVIHHHPYTKGCITCSNLQSCINFIKEHVDENERKAIERNNFISSVFREQKRFCEQYIPLLAKKGWNCGLRSHITAFQEHPETWRTIPFNPHTKPKGGWFTKYKRERRMSFVLDE